MNVTQLINEKGNAVKNQFIITDSNRTIFQSYDSKIATYYNDGELVLNGNTWDYSNTTRNHFKTFINDFTRFKYENKQQWVKEIDSNDKIKITE